ncbi:Putative Zn-dependent protease, contains TPR repeats [Erythrobacter litoralis]|jgi:predicted Zn-dependent protease|uniref:Peptidase M48 n=1 Tax=Erythrobacter litoralis TaxID=39960 RepID=A0A074MXG7_9SPHN|nr:M48 family metalloprotease [Erythrobacter litoralis]AOL24990.1 Putative Zn-dependent protease, contains TPR repeats [Erythrobacter litoralis]KEO96513.1 peptidase M48 [Erythrobacter litoralis]MEE4337609.1 M48 family metalloprotease [Erythrobacter sp.]
MSLLPALSYRAAPWRPLAYALAFLASLALAATQAAAQSVLRDAETEALLADMARPLVEASELEPENVEIVLINDPSINAFVAGGQVVYIHTGLLSVADTANEVQGVIAHELGHITAGHVVRFEERVKAAQGITILSLLLGVGAALAGAGEAAMGAMMAGQQAAMGSFLAFNRNQEASTDLAGARYLSGAGITGKGMISFFEKLRNFEIRRGYSQADEAAYGRTHPLSGDRIQTLRGLLQQDEAWDAPEDRELQERFERVQAKLYGYLAEPERTLNAYPPSDMRVAARYARAYAWHKDARVEKALAEADALLAMEPNNPYFLELEGQVLLESGRPDEALVPLRRATELTLNQPLIASMFGHALIATEDEANYAEAERVLRAAVGRDRLNPFAWYQLGMVYAARGDIARARLASAEQQVMARRYPEALRSAQAAEAALPRGTPDWIRAQDIALQARSALERLRDSR